jgi:hypothetical protein
VDDFLSSGGTIEDLKALATTKLDDGNDADGFNANGSVTSKSLTSGFQPPMTVMTLMTLV